MKLLNANKEINKQLKKEKKCILKTCLLEIKLAPQKIWIVPFRVFPFEKKRAPKRKKDK